MIWKSKLHALLHSGALSRPLDFLVVADHAAGRRDSELQPCDWLMILPGVEVTRGWTYPINDDGETVLSVSADGIACVAFGDCAVF